MNHQCETTQNVFLHDAMKLSEVAHAIAIETQQIFPSYPKGL
jgi:hypothetical protein